MRHSDLYPFGLTRWELVALLEFLMHHATPEMRFEMMRGLPRAYNALCSERIVHVVDRDGGEMLK